MRYELAQETRERDAKGGDGSFNLSVWQKIFNNQIWELGHEYDNWKVKAMCMDEHLN